MMSFGFIRIVSGFAPVKVFTTSRRIASHQRLADDLAVNDDWRDRLGARTLVLQCHMPSLYSNASSTGYVPKSSISERQNCFSNSYSHQMCSPKVTFGTGGISTSKHRVFFLRLKFHPKCKILTYQKMNLGLIAPCS
jgi:hypothetical protein